jgi:pantoate kinase
LGSPEVIGSFYHNLLTPGMKTYSAFSPCQITGFFQIHDHYPDPAHKGSTGAGVNLEHGVRTKVAVRGASRDRISIRLDGRVLTRPSTSKRVIDAYLPRTQRHWIVRVEHFCKLPIGAGYGTSGAGAASLSLALNAAFGSQLSRTEVLKIAHIADVEASTGLGTVASVSESGLAVRVEPGAPGIGTVRRLALPSNLRVVSGSFGPISKVRVLSNRVLRKRINICSRGLTSRLLTNPDASNFANLSRKFADCLGLISTRLRNVLNTLDGRHVVASMMMLGDGGFCIVPRNRAAGIAGLFRSVGMKSLVSRVGGEGAHLV